MNRAALILGTNPKTVARKLVFLGGISEAKLRSERELEARPLVEIQFDELECYEHTKMKPLSIHLGVDGKTRKILSVQVSRMPAKGLLAEKSRKKYGSRKDERPHGLRSLMFQLKPWVGPKTLLRSDANPHYPAAVNQWFPDNKHQRDLSRRGRVDGYGELKKVGFDPLFSLNHTCAMLRDSIKRLARRTWCTTKRPDRLAHHLALYALFHNTTLLP